MTVRFPRSEDKRRTCVYGTFDMPTSPRNHENEDIWASREGKVSIYMGDPLGGNGKIIYAMSVSFFGLFFLG